LNLSPAYMSVLSTRAKLEDIRRFPFKGFPFPLTRQLRQTREIPDLHTIRVAIVDTIRQKNEKPHII
jgi:hypothetical protein